MENTKYDRLLEIFFRSLRGEELSVKNLALEYNVSTKSISRDINNLKAFLADHRTLTNNAEMNYSNQTKKYQLYMDEFLTNAELFSMIEVMIGARAFSKNELTNLIDKLKKFAVSKNRRKLNELIRKELYHYPEVKHDCESVIERVWTLVDCINEKKEITLEYFRMDRRCLNYRIRPVSLMFTDYYFYLIAFKTDEDKDLPFYFRVDRIKNITKHRKQFTAEEVDEFDEGLLRKRSLFMWAGKLRTISFEYTGESIQAVLDKLPTARIINHTDEKYILKAEVYGEGIIMWLLSQGKHIKVIGPEEFVDRMKEEIDLMRELYIKTEK